jgi:hypothetical protein
VESNTDPELKSTYLRVSRDYHPSNERYIDLSRRKTNVIKRTVVFDELFSVH